MNFWYSDEETDKVYETIYHVPSSRTDDTDYFY